MSHGHTRRARPAASIARQGTLRESNLALVLRTVLASESAMSRAGVAAATQLTRSTVSRLVDDLVAGGLLDELEPPPVTGPGRPATPLRPGHGMAALGLQVQPSGLFVRVVDLVGRVVAEEVAPDELSGSDPARTLRRLGERARRVLDAVSPGVRVVGAGLALPGIVSAGSGHLLLAPNLGWSDVDALDHLAPYLGGLPLVVGNEADLAARTIAEVAPGRAGSLTDFVYVSGEVGIGGAAVFDGHVLTGRHGWAGEVGHVCVDPSGPACRCGSTGCLEQYAGRAALVAAAGLPPGSMPARVAELADDGDPASRQALATAAWALGVALAGVVNLLDLPVIVLGGDLGQVAGHLVPDLERSLAQRVPSAHWVPPTIETAADDTSSGATGAAYVVLDEVVDDPARWVDERASAPAG